MEVILGNSEDINISKWLQKGFQNIQDCIDRKEIKPFNQLQTEFGIDSKEIFPYLRIKFYLGTFLEFQMDKNTSYLKNILESHRLKGHITRCYEFLKDSQKSHVWKSKIKWENDLHIEITEFENDLKIMNGVKLGLYWKIMWGFVSPLLIISLFIFYLVDYIMAGTLQYKAWDATQGQLVTKNYPTHALVIIGLLVGASISCIFFGVLIHFINKRLRGT
ncbi:sodium- and chloride-dependent transporter XTRP3 isoform X3 [Pelobates cultripes]|uniref:Sodium- and chloride-dependent transporter XTRP3 isoform X3 n=1 Tax=Pelobates cultripes TaxID=61616 RepID=A0AAD1RZJ6_PELCU|nr:sodium- and chloride-dependent transporter XTRP3 isoform X3 [Pelobates cultripes]